MGRIITPIPFSRVRKLEFPELVNGVVSIVGKYDPAALHIEGMYNLLLEAQPQVSNLKVIYKKHPESAVLKGLRLKRKDLLMGIQNHVKGLAKARVASMTDEIDRVLPFAEKYFSNILNDNSKTATERIKQMFLDLEADAGLKAAVTKVGLGIYLDELDSLQQSFRNSIVKRRATAATEARPQTKQVKSDVGVALSDLVDAIELAYKEFPAVNYMPMVNEINKLFNEYLSDIKARSTRNKNGAASTDKTDTSTAA